MHYVQQLRKDEDVFRRGKQGLGAIEPTTSEIANWTIALCAATATTRKSPDPISTVRFARAAVRLSEPCPPDAFGNLAIAHAKTFGQAIDSLLDDMRSGTFATWKNEPHPSSLSIRFFNNGGRIVVNLWRFAPGAALPVDAVIVYRGDNPADCAQSLTYIHELDGLALERLAEVLGPK